MSWFTKFDSWVKSIGDKIIKPVAKVGVYVTSTLLGVPAAGKKITDAWDTQEQIQERENAQNAAYASSSQTLQTLKDKIKNIPPGTWYFFGFLILLIIFYNNNKKKKR